MIKVQGISKQFDDILAVDQVSLVVNQGEVFGLVGTNGAGKSTFLRMLCGIIKPDKGTICFEDEAVFENLGIKKEIFYISDDAFFFNNATAEEVMKFYSNAYENFDVKKFHELSDKFELPVKRRINTYSKGMKKQLSMLYGICANTRYIICDETFDGLDPVMRQAVKGILAGEIDTRGLTSVIASHNLRELEDICDHVGLLHKGGILLSCELEQLKCGVHKVQCVFRDFTTVEKVREQLGVLHMETRGSLNLMTVKGSEEKIRSIIEQNNPIFYELLPLSLEEIFIHETEEAGYEIKNFII